MPHKIRSQKKKSLLAGLSNLPDSIDKEENKCFLLSFKYLDKNQGQSFSLWERENILAKALETLSGYCKKTLQSQYSKSFTLYGDFPPKNKTDYQFPKHVPRDAKWARIHVQGKECIAGHIHHNVFYVVFLDKDHRFWISDLQSR